MHSPNSITVFAVWHTKSTTCVNRDPVEMPAEEASADLTFIGTDYDNSDDIIIII